MQGATFCRSCPWLCCYKTTSHNSECRTFVLPSAIIAYLKEPVFRNLGTVLAKVSVFVRAKKAVHPYC